MTLDKAAMPPTVSAYRPFVLVIKVASTTLGETGADMYR